MTHKRHLLRSHSEVAPGRLLLCFGRYSEPPAGRTVSARAFGIGKGFGIGMGADIGVGQFVLALPASPQVGGQLVSGKERAFLNADPMVAEDYHVGTDRHFFRRLSASLNVEPIHARVLPLVKAEIPDLHEISFNGHQGSLGPSWMDLPADRMPGCGRLLRCRHVTRL